MRVALSEGDYCNATLSLKKGGLIGGWSLVGVALSERDYCNATLSLKGGMIGGWSLVRVALSERDYCNATLSLKKGGLDRRVVFGESGLIRGGLL